MKWTPTRFSKEAVSLAEKLTKLVAPLCNICTRCIYSFGTFRNLNSCQTSSYSTWSKAFSKKAICIGSLFSRCFSIKVSRCRDRFWKNVLANVESKASACFIVRSPSALHAPYSQFLWTQLKPSWVCHTRPFRSAPNNSFSLYCIDCRTIISFKI